MLRAQTFKAGAIFALTAAQLLCMNHQVGAQEFPSRPIKFIIPVSVGGAVDVFLRALGQKLQERLGQPIIIESRPGGNFLIAGRACAEAPPDGYTFCMLTPETLVHGPLLYKDAGYNPNEAFTPVSHLFYNTQVIVADAGLKVKTLKDLAEAAKKTPGSLSYAYITPSNKLVMDRFNKKNGTDIVTVPTPRGGSAVLNSVITGSTALGMATITTFVPFVKEGKLVPLVIDSFNRSPLFPDAQTLAEAGHNEKNSRNYWGLVAPVGVPPKIIDQLQQAIKQIADEPEFKQRHMIERGLEPVMSSPKDLAAFLKEDTESFVEIMKEAGLTLQ